ncbi:MAG TPA: branched-chain amino acid ABC transporter permease [Acetobacteraceae bacterium]|nr:branched-chain amino acid ABC transporter permease [Acetobacteraceae bacterium]
MNSLIPVGQALLSGILVGGVYGLLSIGFSLAFGVMRIVNFAHGDLVMYGMYVGVAAALFGIDPLYAIPISFVLMALLGAAQYRFVYRRFVGAPTLQQLLAAIGLGLVLQMIAQIVFGADTRSAPSMFAGRFLLLGPLFVSAAQVVAFGVAVAATLIVEALLLGTQWGRTVRAVADDIEAAELVGLRSQWINISAFAFACGLAGIAGTIMVTYYPVDPSKGLTLMPIAIIATTIGGLGSIRGSFLGGIFCGVIQQATALLWNSALQDVPLYVLLLLFIAYRPTGMFGLRTE